MELNIPERYGIEMDIEQAYQVMFTQYPDILTVKEVGMMLGIGQKKTYNLIQRGIIQRIPCGRIIKVPKIRVIEYVLNNQ